MDYTFFLQACCYWREYEDDAEDDWRISSKMSWGSEAVEREEAGHRGASISQGHGEDKTTAWMGEKQRQEKEEKIWKKEIMNSLSMYIINFCTCIMYCII